MSYSPAMVTMFIPLMKDLNLSWSEIKATPRVELMGLAQALSEYNVLHSFDGYDGKYNEYLKKRRQYGIERGAKSLFEAVQ
jgi:hypothetical protein